MIQLECYRRNMVDPALLTVNPVLLQLPSARASLPAMHLHVIQMKITAPRLQDELSCQLLNNPIGHQETRAVRMGTVYSRSSQVAEC